MITVMGATGRVGGKVAGHLLDHGHGVRAVARSLDKLSGLAQRGAALAAGDASDAAFLTEAFRGSSAVFIFMPHEATSPDYHRAQDTLGQSIVQAVRDSGVRHVVCLSSIGADQATGTGVLESLHRQEQRLRNVDGLNVLILRAGYFFENFLESLPLIKQHAIVCDCVERDRKVPMVATRDIAHVAAHALHTCDWEGVVTRELIGPRDLTYSQCTALIAERTGNPALQYLEVTYDYMKETLIQAGFSPDVAAQYVGLSRGINEGRVVPLDAPDRSVTPTRFEDFVEEIAAAYSRLGN